MSKKLKLEVGKRYATEGGDTVFIFKKCLPYEAGDFVGALQGGGISFWKVEGTSSTNHTITRCLDDGPELVDLTKIDVPFGELDERTQDRLAGIAARGGIVQVYDAEHMLWEDILIYPAWRAGSKYRAKPEEPTYTLPTVDDKVWLAMPGAKAIAWDEGVGFGCAHSTEPKPSRGEWWTNPLAEIKTELRYGLFGDRIQRGDCPWDQAIVLRPEGL